MLKRPLIHTVLFSQFPILFLYAQNATEMHISEVFLPIVLAFAFSMILYVGLRYIVPDPFRRAILSSLVILGFFSYGHVTGLLNTVSFIKGWAPIVVLVVGLVVFVSMVRMFGRTTKPLAGFTRFLNYTSMLLVLFQIIMISRTLIARDDLAAPEVADASNLIARKDLPDIYYIILDGYGRHDVLKDEFGLDNSDFLNSLRSLGFFVADSSHSNYCATLQSLASSLNLDYLPSLGRFNPNSFDRTPLSRIVAGNKLFQYLDRFGYKQVGFETGHAAADLSDVDVFCEPGAALSEFQNILINTTPIFHLLNWGPSQFSLHRDRITYSLEKLGNLDYVESPKIVVGHLISPHPPFVFGENGEHIQRTWPFSFADGDHFATKGGTREEYITGYSNQLKYVSGQILLTIKEIIQESDPDPIIIIQGDHGPGSGLYWQDLPKTNIKERFSILNAYYLPGLKDKSLLTHDLSPVNTFRLILKDYFREQLDLLENRHYYTTRARPFQYYEISDRLR